MIRTSPPARGRRARWGAAAALALLAATAAPLPAEVPGECGTMATIIANLESLRDAGEYDRALAARRRLPVDDLATGCRLYVKRIEAGLLIALDRESEARQVFGSMLDEVPSWRPERDYASAEVRRVFEQARSTWVKANAGPLRVTPGEVSLLSADSDVSSSSQPLLIQAMQQGELTWRVRADEPWIELSRARGTTIGGRDTVVVSARTFPEAEPASTQEGRLVFEAPPWPDVEVDVSWHVLSPPEPVVVGEPAGRRRWLLLGIGAVVLGTVVGIAAR